MRHSRYLSAIDPINPLPILIFLCSCHIIKIGVLSWDTSSFGILYKLWLSMLLVNDNVPFL